MRGWNGQVYFMKNEPDIVKELRETDKLNYWCKK